MYADGRGDANARATEPDGRGDLGYQHFLVGRDGLMLIVDSGDDVRNERGFFRFQDQGGRGRPCLLDFYLFESVSICGPIAFRSEPLKTKSKAIGRKIDRQRFTRVILIGFPGLS